jgi:hypothetical protein
MSRERRETLGHPAGAEARFLFWGLYAALKRRSSTSLHAYVTLFHGAATGSGCPFATFGVCATVEERPFQGRVRSPKDSRALAPVVVFSQSGNLFFSWCDRYHASLPL